LDQAADKFFILSTGHSTTGLDAVVEVDGNKVKVTRRIAPAATADTNDEADRSAIE
jgi:hypothetical protein